MSSGEVDDGSTPVRRTARARKVNPRFVGADIDEAYIKLVGRITASNYSEAKTENKDKIRSSASETLSEPDLSENQSVGSNEDENINRLQIGDNFVTVIGENKIHFPSKCESQNATGENVSYSFSASGNQQGNVSLKTITVKKIKKGKAGKVNLTPSLEFRPSIIVKYRSSTESEASDVSIGSGNENKRKLENILEESETPKRVCEEDDVESRLAEVLNMKSIVCGKSNANYDSSAIGLCENKNLPQSFLGNIPAPNEIFKSTTQISSSSNQASINKPEQNAAKVLVASSKDDVNLPGKKLKIVSLKIHTDQNSGKQYDNKIMCSSLKSLKIVKKDVSAGKFPGYPLDHKFSPLKKITPKSNLKSEKKDISPLSTNLFSSDGEDDIPLTKLMSKEGAKKVLPNANKVSNKKKILVKKQAVKTKIKGVKMASSGIKFKKKKTQCGDSLLGKKLLKKKKSQDDLPLQQLRDAIAKIRKNNAQSKKKESGNISKTKDSIKAKKKVLKAKTLLKAKVKSEKAQKPLNKEKISKKEKPDSSLIKKKCAPTVPKLVVTKNQKKKPMKFRMKFPTLNKKSSKLDLTNIVVSVGEKEGDYACVAVDKSKVTPKFETKGSPLPEEPQKKYTYVEGCLLPGINQGLVLENDIPEAIPQLLPKKSKVSKKFGTFLSKLTIQPDATEKEEISKLQKQHSTNSISSPKESTVDSKPLSALKSFADNAPSLLILSERSPNLKTNTSPLHHSDLNSQDAETQPVPILDEHILLPKKQSGSSLFCKKLQSGGFVKLENLSSEMPLDSKNKDKLNDILLKESKGHKRKREDRSYSVEKNYKDKSEKKSKEHVKDKNKYYRHDEKSKDSGRKEEKLIKKEVMDKSYSNCKETSESKVKKEISSITNKVKKEISIIPNKDLDSGKVKKDKDKIVKVEEKNDKKKYKSHNKDEKYLSSSPKKLDKIESIEDTNKVASNSSDDKSSLKSSKNPLSLSLANSPFKSSDDKSSLKLSKSSDDKSSLKSSKSSHDKSSLKASKSSEDKASLKSSRSSDDKSSLKSSKNSLSLSLTNSPSRSSDDKSSLKSLKNSNDKSGSKSSKSSDEKSSLKSSKSSSLSTSSSKTSDKLDIKSSRSSRKDHERSHSKDKNKDQKAVRRSRERSISTHDNTTENSPKSTPSKKSDSFHNTKLETPDKPSEVKVEGSSEKCKAASSAAHIKHDFDLSIMFDEKEYTTKKKTSHHSKHRRSRDDPKLNLKPDSNFEAESKNLDEENISVKIESNSESLVYSSADDDSSRMKSHNDHKSSRQTSHHSKTEKDRYRDKSDQKVPKIEKKSELNSDGLVSEDRKNKYDSIQIIETSGKKKESTIYSKGNDSIKKLQGNSVTTNKVFKMEIFDNKKKVSKSDHDKRPTEEANSMLSNLKRQEKKVICKPELVVDEVYLPSIHLKVKEENKVKKEILVDCAVEKSVENKVPAVIKSSNKNDSGDEKQSVAEVRLKKNIQLPINETLKNNIDKVVELEEREKPGNEGDFKLYMDLEEGNDRKKKVNILFEGSSFTESINQIMEKEKENEIKLKIIDKDKANEGDAKDTPLIHSDDSCIGSLPKIQKETNKTYSSSVSSNENVKMETKNVVKKKSTRWEIVSPLDSKPNIEKSPVPYVNKAVSAKEIDILSNDTDSSYKFQTSPKTIDQVSLSHVSNLSSTEKTPVLKETYIKPKSKKKSTISMNDYIFKSGVFNVNPKGSRDSDSSLKDKNIEKPLEKSKDSSCKSNIITVSSNVVPNNEVKDKIKVADLIISQPNRNKKSSLESMIDQESNSMIISDKSNQIDLTYTKKEQILVAQNKPEVNKNYVVDVSSSIKFHDDKLKDLESIDPNKLPTTMILKMAQTTIDDSLSSTLKDDILTVTKLQSIEQNNEITNVEPIDTEPKNISEEDDIMSENSPNHASKIFSLNSDINIDRTTDIEPKCKDQILIPKPKKKPIISMVDYLYQSVFKSTTKLSDSVKTSIDDGSSICENSSKKIESSVKKSKVPSVEVLAPPHMPVGLSFIPLPGEEMKETKSKSGSQLEELKEEEEDIAPFMDFLSCDPEITESDDNTEIGNDVPISNPVIENSEINRKEPLPVNENEDCQGRDNVEVCNMKSEVPVSKFEEKRELTVEEKLEVEKINNKIVEDRMKSFEHLEENLYLVRNVRNKSAKEVRRMVCDCTLSREEIKNNEKGCGEDCLNKLLMIECGSRCTLKDNCMNKNFQKKTYANVQVFNAEEKGCGIRACTDIIPGTFIMEYIGEVFDTKEFKRRRREYGKNSSAHFYFMALNQDRFIDATLKGNISRFINHSCSPNAETQKWTVNGDLRIGFFSTKHIAAGEEINFDYRLERYGREPQKCYCGTAGCRGWLGESPDEKTKEEKEEDRRKEMRDKKRRLERRSYFYDLDLDDEIEKLNLRGLRNRQDTLNLSRLMVRALDSDTRMRLLKMLESGEEACKRLFLDYHGLKLLWSWMADISSSPKSIPLKLEILKTLSSLPIIDKTQLTESKVLNVVERWSKDISRSSISDEKNQTDESNEQSSAADKNDLSEDSDTDTPDSKDEILDPSPTDTVSPDDSSLDSSETPINLQLSQDNVCTVAEESNITNIEDENSSSSSPPDTEPATEFSVVELASKLLPMWNNLKEAFKIPRRQRLQLMKEHEREVDREFKEYLTKNTKSEEERTQAFYDRWRYGDKDKEKSRKKERMSDKKRKRIEREEDNLSKEQRRERFAIQVAKEDEAARQKKLQEDMWNLHSERCALLGHDPYYTPIFDPSGRFYWDPNTVSWQAYLGPSGNLPVPATYGGDPGLMENICINSSLSQMFTMGAFYPLPHTPVSDSENGLLVHGQLPDVPMDTLNISHPDEDFLLHNSPSIVGSSVMDVDGSGLVLNGLDSTLLTSPGPVTIVLPVKWKMARDKLGYLYFYHTKTRYSQWELPTPDLHLKLMTQYSLTSDSESDFDSDSDSENSSNSEDFSSDDDDTEKEEKEEAHVQTSQGGGGDKMVKRIKGQRKHSVKLVQERVISPVFEDREALKKARREAKDRAREDARQERRANKAMRDFEDSYSIKESGGTYNDNEDDQADFSMQFLKSSKYRHHIDSKTTSKEKCKERAATALADKRDLAKKIKDNFRVQMAEYIVSLLSPYRKPDCPEGRINSTDDFKYLAKKLTTFVLVKELKQLPCIDELDFSDSVKHKTKEFVKKYMGKYGAIFKRDPNDTKVY